MRLTLIERIKSEIEANLKSYLREEGIEIVIAANDNSDLIKDPFVELEATQDNVLNGSVLLHEIKLILSVLGKPWQCKALVDGIYEALHPHHITQCELTILLMSLHVETVHCVRARRIKNRVVMRYIVEKNSTPTASSGTDENHIPDIKVEYC